MSVTESPAIPGEEAVGWLGRLLLELASGEAARENVTVLMLALTADAHEYIDDVHLLLSPNTKGL